SYRLSGITRHLHSFPTRRSSDLDAACTDRLADLTASPDAVLRYGAFLALRLADENNPAARGALVNNSFWLHRLAPGSPGLVHLTDRKSTRLNSSHDQNSYAVFCL